MNGGQLDDDKHFYSQIADELNTFQQNKSETFAHCLLGWVDAIWSQEREQHRTNGNS